jgi:hypothetical protein
MKLLECHCHLTMKVAKASVIGKKRKIIHFKLNKSVPIFKWKQHQNNECESKNECDASPTRGHNRRSAYAGQGRCHCCIFRGGISGRKVSPFNNMILFVNLKREQREEFDRQMRESWKRVFVLLSNSHILVEIQARKLANELCMFLSFMNIYF